MYVFGFLFGIATIVAAAMMWDTIGYYVNRRRVVDVLKNYPCSGGYNSEELIRYYKVNSSYVYGILRDLENDGRVTVLGMRHNCRYVWRK